MMLTAGWESGGADKVQILGVQTGNGTFQYTRGNCTLQARTAEHVHRFRMYPNLHPGGWHIITSSVGVVVRQNPDAPDDLGFTPMQCRQTNTITLPQPAMDWTCGLAVRGNFTCMGGAAALPDPFRIAVHPLWATSTVSWPVKPFGFRRSILGSGSCHVMCRGCVNSLAMQFTVFALASWLT